MITHARSQKKIHYQSEQVFSTGCCEALLQQKSPNLPATTDIKALKSTFKKKLPFITIANHTKPNHKRHKSKPENFIKIICTGRRYTSQLNLNVIPERSLRKPLDCLPVVNFIDGEISSRNSRFSSEDFPEKIWPQILKPVSHKM